LSWARIRESLEYECSDTMNNIARRLPAQLLDRAIDCCSIWANEMIQLELDYPRHLDAERLREAFHLTLDAEPILCCRWVPQLRRPYWERIEKRSRDTFLLTSDKIEYEKFLNRSIDPTTGPQIEVCLWRCSDRDRLLLKVSHYVADAAGVKDIAARMSVIYSRLFSEPHYRPEANIHGSRSCWQVIRRVPWYLYPRLYLEYRRRSRDVLPLVCHKLAIQEGPHTPLVFLHRLISEDRVARLSNYRVTSNATINDIMLTALLRAQAALGNWDGQTQLTMDSTVDLRRYLAEGSAGAVANLSVAVPFFPNLGTNLGKDFASTLERIASITRERKANWLGVPELIGWYHLLVPRTHWMATELCLMAYQRHIQNEAMRTNFINFGLISEDGVKFDSKPVNAWILTPPLYPPGFSIGVSGYAGSLTMSTGVYPSQEHIAELLFDKILVEIPN
jgi:NRPS condensation-like uncharacterized protein